MTAPDTTPDRRNDSVTYLNTSAFTLCLVPYLLKRKRVVGRAGYEPLPLEVEPGLSRPLPTAEILPPLTIRETRDLAIIFCFLWFIANWTLNVALDYTSVASATILSSTSGLFTLAIGRIFKVEILTVVKFGAVILSFTGVVLVSLSDSSSSPLLEPNNLLLGDIMALISAIVYALYVTLLKVRIRIESRVDMQLFFGFVGLFNVLTCWVVGVVLHVSGVEPFELPTSSAVIKAILINMFFTLSSDYIYLIAMLKTTPLVVTVGLSLTIPLAVIGDLLLGRAVKGMVFLGALLVIFSFVMVGLDDARLRSIELDNDTATLLPKESRRRSGGHEPSVKLGKRSFAVQDNAVEHVHIGGAIDASGSEILQSLSVAEKHPVLKKKEKIQAKHDAFLQRLETSSSPYSKSHARRLKRKAKEQIANGLGDMQSAIEALDQDIPTLVEQSRMSAEEVPQRKQHLKPGMVGEGKKAPLSKSQRKRALYV
ncbi:hypothetical protein DXG01_000125 [Tephrocybe rancida]|nr:hypothetical protein DXG01_000125 [Tephrocybe rancida]